MGTMLATHAQMVVKINCVNIKVAIKYMKYMIKMSEYVLTYSFCHFSG